ncbi:transposase [Clostridium beijerinckii]|uniref:transposase n=1 Tax=Clostridium beijerinckii TaxID=1520 RepID=UPI000A46EE1F|nr:transposase [Clostridium beijerinckii]
MRRKSYTEDFKKMIIEVYNTGKPIKEICKEYGVSTAEQIFRLITAVELKKHIKST